MSNQQNNQLQISENQLRSNINELDSLQSKLLEAEYDWLPATADYELMLTTKDNEFNPFTETDSWANFDEKEKHYNTRNFLARKVVWSDQMSDNDKILAINQAVIEIVSDPLFNWFYKAVACRL